MPTLEEQFHADMIRIYERTRDECDWTPTRFLQMVCDHGGVEAAKQLIMAAELHEGLVRLWELGRLDLSAEALVLREKYRVLFTDEERARARKRLRELNYEPDQAD